MLTSAAARELERGRRGGEGDYRGDERAEHDLPSSPTLTAAVLHRHSLKALLRRGDTESAPTVRQLGSRVSAGRGRAQVVRRVYSSAFFIPPFWSSRNMTQLCILHSESVHLQLLGVTRLHPLLQLSYRGCGTWGRGMWGQGITCKCEHAVYDNDVAPHYTPRRRGRGTTLHPQEEGEGRHTTPPGGGGGAAHYTPRRRGRGGTLHPQEEGEGQHTTPPGGGGGAAHYTPRRRGRGGTASAATLLEQPPTPAHPAPVSCPAPRATPRASLVPSTS